MIELSKNALKILKERYLKKDEKGRVIEKPEDMFRRVAQYIASADLIYDKKADIKKRATEFYQMLSLLKFLPNAPTLRSAGRPPWQLLACFVIPVEDSMESIFEAVKNLALIQKVGGGTGFSFSRLRPAGSQVGETGGVASGPVSFLNVFDAATGAIKAGGTRRGANMAVLRVDHPDILKFILAKRNPWVLTNFNISVAITDKFIEAYKKNQNYELIDPRTKKVVRKINTRRLMKHLTESAWLNGEPGAIFIDTVNRYNPTPALGKIEAVNPCGESPLLPYEACVLGSIDLSKMVKEGKIDWPELEKITKLAVHFLDNVIDKNKYPLPQIEKMTKGNRKIGLGVMGFADMLIKLGIPYDSWQAVKIAQKIMKFIRDKGREASINLAKQRGVFPNFKKSIYYKKKMRLRNATITTIAPTGTLAIIAGTSAGIEPLFSLVYKRLIIGPNREYYLEEINPLFKEIGLKEGWYNKEIEKEVVKSGRARGIKGIPKRIQRIFITAHEIKPIWHVRIQSAFQKYTDNSISKTINLPYWASKKDVEKIFLLAYKLGCKGIALYRDMSRKKQVLVAPTNRFYER